MRKSCDLHNLQLQMTLWRERALPTHLPVGPLRVTYSRPPAPRPFIVSNPMTDWSVQPPVRPSAAILFRLFSISNLTTEEGGRERERSVRSSPTQVGYCLHRMATVMAYEPRMRPTDADGAAVRADDPIPHPQPMDGEKNRGHSAPYRTTRGQRSSASML